MTNPVLPASAGMIPVSRTVCMLSSGAPRIRGDDPNSFRFIHFSILCSPHPRG